MSVVAISWDQSEPFLLFPILTNCALHQSELKMEAAGTHVTLHLSSHLRNAGWSAQFSLACLM